MSDKLILRTSVSPYGDTTKGSVLSAQELDGNLIMLKGAQISSISLNGNSLNVVELNGSNFNVDLSQFTQDTTITGGTFANSTLILSNNTGGTVTITGFTMTAQSETYTNTNPTPTTIGGIPANSTFSGKTMQQMWDSLLYPYQLPTFSTFTVSGSSSFDYEIGQSLSGNLNFAWGNTNSGNINASSIYIQQLRPSTTTLQSGLDVNSNININVTTPISASSITNVAIFQINGTNTNSGNFNRTVSANWQIRWYYGKSTNASVTQSEITGFTNGLVTSVVGSKVQWGPTVGYGYLIIPTTISQPTDLRDSTSGCFGNNIPYSNIGQVTFNNAYGISVTYNVYRTTNQLSSTQNVWMCS